MPSVPFPLTGLTIDDFRSQVYELIRYVYEETIGGANLGDVFSIVGDVLTLTLATTSGLTKDGNELAVEVTSDGGLTIGTSGLYIKIVTDGGLETTTSGIGIKLDPASNPTLALTADGLKVNPLGAYAQMGVENTGHFIIDGSSHYYLGAIDTNGSWRIARDGDNLIFQRREAGVWVTKDTITP